MNINTGDNDVEVMVEIKANTRLAVLVNDGDRDVWLSRSQIEIVEEGGQTFVQMPEWLAIEKELV